MGLVAAAAMAGSQALAAGADMPLAPGKPAGVQQAQRHGPNLLLIGGVAALVVAGVVVAVATAAMRAAAPPIAPPTTSSTSTS